MKYLILVFLFAASVGAFAQNNEFIRAYFENDSLFVIDSNITANCAAKFRVDTIITQNDSIKVFFADTFVLKADCICKFTLKAIISKVPAGNIVVAVYRNEYKKYDYPADTTIFIGQVKIIIPQAMKAAYSRFEQSDCYSHNPDNVGENEIQYEEKAFPNPSEGRTKLEFSLVQPGSATLNIYDIYGKNLCSRTLSALSSGNNNVEVDCSAFPPGVYYCTLTSDFGERKFFKFILN